jgi:adenylate cyclase
VEAQNDIDQVLGSHLGPRDRPSVTSLLLGEPFRRLLLSFGMARTERDQDDEALALLRLIAGGSVDLERLERELMAAVGDAHELGVPVDAFPALAQAWARAVGRIVDAESETARGLLAGVPEEKRAEALDRLLAAALPVTSTTFDVLHAALLHDALAEALTPDSLGEAEGAPAAIALVDLVGSTHYLARATTAEASELVDTLFEAGQLATVDRATRPVKYVGDGVFLAGRDTAEVADAALDALAHLAENLPIPARAGLAYGPVLRRAGDFFGLPMNMAQILTKAARPGALLATDEAAAELPAGMVGRRRVLRSRRGYRNRVREVVRPEAGG